MQVLLLEATMDLTQVPACLLQLIHAVKLMSTAPPFISAPICPYLLFIMLPIGMGGLGQLSH